MLLTMATANSAEDPTTGVGGKNTASSSKQGIQQQPEPFPFKLYDMLEDASIKGFEDIVSWLPSGKPNGFRVHDIGEFVRTILPVYFHQQTRYKSFQRQLNMYDFKTMRGRGARKVTADGDDRKGTFLHPIFVRGNRNCCRLITRKTSGIHYTEMLKSYQQQQLEKQQQQQQQQALGVGVDAASVSLQHNRQHQGRDGQLFSNSDGIPMNMLLPHVSRSTEEKIDHQDNTTAIASSYLQQASTKYPPGGNDAAMMKKGDTTTSLLSGGDVSSFLNLSQDIFLDDVRRNVLTKSIMEEKNDQVHTIRKEGTDESPPSSSASSFEAMISSTIDVASAPATAILKSYSTSISTTAFDKEVEKEIKKLPPRRKQRSLQTMDYIGQTASPLPFNDQHQNLLLSFAQDAARLMTPDHRQAYCDRSATDDNDGDDEIVDEIISTFALGPPQP